MTDDDLHPTIVHALWDALAGESAAQAFASREAGTLAATLTTLAHLRETGAITEEQARGALAKQTHATRAVFLACEGMDAVKAERAINAALAAAGALVQKAIGVVI